VRFFVPVKTDPEVHPASCIMGTLGKVAGRGVDYPPLLTPTLYMGRDIFVSPIFAFMAYNKVTFTFTSSSEEKYVSLYIN